MDQSEDSYLLVKGVSRLNTNVVPTSLVDQSTMSVIDVSTRPSDQSGNSSMFLAERTARVNARSRANRVYGASASLDTTATSLLDKSTVSVDSSCNTLNGPSFSFPSHSHQQQLQRHQTLINLAHYHGLYAPNYSDEFSSSWGGGDVAENFPSLLGQAGWNEDWSYYTAESTLRPNLEFEPILPPTSAFSRFSAHPMTSILRSRGGRFVHPTSVRPRDSMQSLPMRSVSLVDASRTNLPIYANRLLEDNEDVSPAPSTLRTRTISIASRNSSSDSANTSRGSSGSRDAKDCSYCLSVNKYAIGHNKHNCPVLADLPPCRICHAEGKYNHTESHCPSQEKTYLEFIPKERRKACTF